MMLPVNIGRVRPAGINYQFSIRIYDQEVWFEDLFGHDFDAEHAMKKVVREFNSVLVSQPEMARYQRASRDGENVIHAIRNESSKCGLGLDPSWVVLYDNEIVTCPECLA